MAETMYATICNVPPVRSIERAVKLYYEKKELTNADIMDLFGVSKTKASFLKQRGLEEQQARNVPRWNGMAVNTACAYRSWGLDIDEMENALRKLRKLGL